jgi:hypothetical protein
MGKVSLGWENGEQHAGRHGDDKPSGFLCASYIQTHPFQEL